MQRWLVDLWFQNPPCYSLRQQLTTPMHDTATQVPHPRCSLSSICPFSPHFKARIPQFFIIPRHQPFISAFTSTWPSCWRNGEFQQPAKFFPKQTSTPICLCISYFVYHIRHYSTTHYTPSKTKTFFFLQLHSSARLLLQSSLLTISSSLPLCPPSFLALPLINADPLRTIIRIASFLYFISHTPKERPPHAFHAAVMERFPQQK